MSKRKKTAIRLVAVAIAVLMPIVTATAAMAANENTGNNTTNIKYMSPDINSLTGHGEDPEELSVTAGAEYLEKAWYEYVTYSDKAVCSYRLSDDYRILFYDPYTYTNTMVMDVQFDATTNEFDTMSSYTISKTMSKTISSCVSSTDTNTSAVQTSGRDYTHTEVQNGGSTKTTYNHDASTKTTGKVTNENGYTYKKQDYETSTFMWNLNEGSDTKFGTEISETIKIGSTQQWTTNNNTAWLTDKVTNSTTYSDDYKTTTTYSGEATVEDNTESTTDGWTELSARVTKTIGSSSSTSNSWSEEESTTVTKTYAATHFASDGVTPLPWAIVHYTVEMPMKCCLQVKYSGEWITISTVYCMLTTVKGTCRAWMENGQVYYEDWGSGEPVVATDFWSQFMTKEQLMNAYQNKLYPVGGVD
ncbi:MAG: hypothetical protein IKB93_10530 [Clostridia bacterium]|nr:hypothetical protein [Clostridia bacterium]